MENRYQIQNLSELVLNVSEIELKIPERVGKGENPVH